jgi:hypothetical protein
MSADVVRLLRMRAAMLNLFDANGSDENAFYMNLAAEALNELETRRQQMRADVRGLLEVVADERLRADQLEGAILDVIDACEARNQPTVMAIRQRLMDAIGGGNV